MVNDYSKEAWRVCADQPRGAWPRMGKAALEGVGLWCGTGLDSVEVVLWGEGSYNLKNVLVAVDPRGRHFFYPRAVLTRAALALGSTAGPHWVRHPSTSEG